MEESLELQEARALGRNGSAPLVSQLWISSGAIEPLIAKMKEKKGGSVGQGFRRAVILLGQDFRRLETDFSFIHCVRYDGRICCI